MMRRNWDILGIVLISFLFKTLLFAFFPHTVFPDEIFQNLEPAQYLISGKGYLPWEYVVGLRSWLMPIIIAGPMKLGTLISSDPRMILAPVYAMMAFLSLIPVICAFFWVKKLENRTAALLVAFCVGVSSDLVIMAVHSFNEVLAAYLLCGALYLAYPGEREERTSRLVFAGFLFAFAFSLRIHLGPALFVAYLFICRTSLRHWIILCGSAAIFTLFSIGILDWASWGVPFRTVWINFSINIIDHISADFGTSSVAQYFAEFVALWGIATIALLMLFALGVKRFPLLSAVVLTIVGVHLLIAHKEWRFVFPAMPLFMIIIGLGLVRVIKDIAKWRTGQNAILAKPSMFAAGLWVIMTASVFATTGTQGTIHRFAERIYAFRYLNTQDKICGVGTLDINPFSVPGSVSLRSTIRLANAELAQLQSQTPYFNAIVTSPEMRDLPQEFRPGPCFDETGSTNGAGAMKVCVWTRPGACRKGIQLNEQWWPTSLQKADGKPDVDRIKRYLPPHTLIKENRGWLAQQR